MQRLRVIWGRDDRLKYISHLDTMRMWERALRRAGLPLAYSEGFSPHPRLSLAAPLAVGMCGARELMDLYLEPEIAVADFLARLEPQLPPGLVLVSVAEADPAAPSMAAALRFADYEVTFDADLPPAAIESRIASLLSAAALPRQRVKEKAIKSYDLRPLIQDLRLVSGSDRPPIIRMRLQAGSTGAGRPEEVMAALGIGGPLRAIKRTGLILA